MARHTSILIRFSSEVQFSNGCDTKKMNLRKSQKASWFIAEAQSLSYRFYAWQNPLFFLPRLYFIDLSAKKTRCNLSEGTNSFMMLLCPTIEWKLQAKVSKPNVAYCAWLLPAFFLGGKWQQRWRSEFLGNEKTPFSAPQNDSPRVWFSLDS